jgi:hypothetical protein
VVSKGAGHDGDTFAPHDAELTVEVAHSPSGHVRIGPTRVEAAIHASPGVSQVLCEKMRVADRMAEERSAGLVKVLAVNEHKDLGRWVRSECRNRWTRHLVIQADRPGQKPRSSQREIGPVDLYTE